MTSFLNKQYNIIQNDVKYTRHNLRHYLIKERKNVFLLGSPE